MSLHNPEKTRQIRWKLKKKKIGKVLQNWWEQKEKTNSHQYLANSDIINIETARLWKNGHCNKMENDFINMKWFKRKNKIKPDCVNS